MLCSIWVAGSTYNENSQAWCVLTHLPLDKMAAISQTIFSDAFSWMTSFVLWLKFHWSVFLMVPFSWQYSSIGSDNGLAQNKRQAIIWSNADPINWCIYMPLGDELTGLINIWCSAVSQNHDLHPLWLPPPPPQCGTCIHWCLVAVGRHRAVLTSYI